MDDSTNPPIVLGREFAAARATENERLETVQAPSPMPARTYDPRGCDLLRVSPVPLDREIAQLCRRLSSLSQGERESLRRSISLDEFYTLLTFARRMSVLALQERTAEPIRDGLLAIALIDSERVDYRDIPLAVSLLSHAASRIGAAAQDFFAEAAAFAEPRVAQFVRELAQPHDLGPAAGYQEVQTKYGIGFIRWGLEPYDPTRNLAALAVELGELLDSDKYQTDTIEIASDLPPVWLEPARDTRLLTTLSRARAGATVSGSLRSDDSETHKLWFFLAEFQDSTDAAVLLDIASNNRPERFATVGITSDCLFCLVVASSIRSGVAPLETAQCLQRFVPGVASRLAAAM